MTCVAVSAGVPSATSYYDTAQLRMTLERPSNAEGIFTFDLALGGRE